LYEFTHNTTDFFWNFPSPLGAFHGSELPFVFHDSNYKFTKDEDFLSKTMVQYWTNFAKTRNPGTVNGFSWPKYINDTNIVLDLQLKTEQGMSTPKQCDFWDLNSYNATRRNLRRNFAKWLHI